MVIGRHECQVAQDIDLKGAIAVGLDEAFTALEESFYDLTDEQVWRFPVPGRNNIAWIVMHCLDNLDEYANGCASGERTIPHEERWDLWQGAPKERPKPGDPFPAQQEMLSMLRTVREAAMPALQRLDESGLVEKWAPHPLKKSRADFYMRTIYHTMSHTRQIWLLRGALGLAEGPWPHQHWA